MKLILRNSFCLLFLCFAFPGGAQKPVPGQLVISLEKSVDSKTWVREFESLRAPEFPGKFTRSTGVSGNILLYEFDAAKADWQILADAFLNQEGVISAQGNYILEKRSVEPNDGFYSAQWSLPLIQIEDVWDVNTGGVNILGDTIVVAIIDSGFKIDHPDLQDNIWVNQAELYGIANVDDDGNGFIDDVYGWNFDGNSPIHPADTHGTAVAGIIGARGNNGTGIAGINWNIKLMVLTVKTTFDIAQAYTYALDLRLKYNETNGEQGAYVAVTNASLGLNGHWCDEYPFWGELYDPLGEAGILNVAATANNNVDVEKEGDMPTSCTSDYLITVTNTDRNDQKVASAAYSNIYIDLGAPGGSGSDGSFTLHPNDDYDESFGGTSAACPHVTGVAALLYTMPCAELYNRSPGETVLLIKQALMEGVDLLDDLEGITVSGGRLNASKSMAYLHAFCQPDKPENFFETYITEKGFIRIGPSPLLSGELLEVVYSSDQFGPIYFTLYDALGRAVYEQQETLIPFEDQTFTIPTANLAGGVYFLVLANGKDPVTYKIMVL
ncbi:MAG: S8 family peptidase [Saprospiraceae bacterium]|nr:S8 family peptidase [Saprospiraceae bacterium]